MPTNAELLRLITLLDLTDLDGSATPARIHALCARALMPVPPEIAGSLGGPDHDALHVAAVCVHPARVADARAALDVLAPPDLDARPSAGVRLASVAGGFPSGQTFLDVKVREIHHAREAGADEIDLVLDRGAFLDADTEAADAGAMHELLTCREAAGDATLKVILETGAFLDADGAERWPGAADRLRTLARLALEAGADMLKTSTGTLQPGATPAAAVLLLDEIAAHEALTGRTAGLKVAGGIRRVEDALAYLQAVEASRGRELAGPEHFRIGASALLDEITRALGA